MFLRILQRKWFFLFRNKNGAISRELYFNVYFREEDELTEMLDTLTTVIYKWSD